MKRFNALAALLAVSLFLFCFDAAGQQAGALILSKNPQLSKIPDWPRPTGVGEPVDCTKDMKMASVEVIRKLGQTAYRCLAVGGTFGGQPWESGAGATALYELQLYPNSPKVWRVFKRNETRMIALVAEFDKMGKLKFSQSARSPTKLLASTQDSDATRRRALRLQPGETPEQCIYRLTLARPAAQSANSVDCRCTSMACGAAAQQARGRRHH